MSLARARRRATTAVVAALAGTTLAGTTLLMSTAPTAAAATLPSLSVLQAEVNSLTSVARKKAGCAPLVLNAQLSLAAQRHANDMAAKKYFSHTSKDGTTWINRIKAAGYAKPGGENIARGYATPTAVVNAWLASPGHKANIVNCKFKAIGVGWAAAGNYWVQDFGY